MLRVSRTNLVKVVCLSLTPKGTSLGPALTRLGYKTYDLDTVFTGELGRRHPATWAGILNGRAQFDLKLFEGHDCLIGLPVSGAYRTVLGHLPEYTKIILVEEMDKEGAEEAFKRAVVPLQESMTKMGKHHAVARTWAAMFERMWPHHNHGHAAALDEFEEFVKKEVPAHRLFVYNPGDGWESLCHFLEVDQVPDEPFPPHDLNEETLNAIRTRMERAQRVTRVLTAITTGLLMIILAPVFIGLMVDGEKTVREAKDSVESLDPNATAAAKKAAALLSGEERPSHIRDLIDLSEPAKKAQ